MKCKFSSIGLMLIFGLLLIVTGGFSQTAAEYDYDVLIKNGNIFDGSLNPSFKADIAVKDGRIVRISESIEGTAAQVIDAEGLTVTPGFIDLHTHVDRGMYFPENRACLNFLKQGVTTVVVGQCGSSAWPIFEKAEDQMTRWTEEGIGLNAALLVGHGTVRQLVMGDEDSTPTPEELEEMKTLVKEAMEQGASGISTGLIYRPGRYAQTDEIIELVRVIAPYKGIYHSHIRNEAEELTDALTELIEIAEKAGIRAHISHFKVVGKKNWGNAREACILVEKAREKGLKITADQYPYRFANLSPYRSLIPGDIWLGEEEHLTAEDIARVFDYLRDSDLINLYAKVTPYSFLSENFFEYLNGLPRKRLVNLVAQTLVNRGRLRSPENARARMLFLQRMNNPEEARNIRQALGEYIERLGAPENIVVGICVEKEFEGKTLKEIAGMKGKSAEDTAIELELMGAKAIPLQMCEEDIEYIMQKDYVATGSDGATPFYGIGLPHIRSYSTFLHKIKKYSQERKSVSFSHVIRSQTSLPAQIMNWNDRGQIKEDYKADIVIFNPGNIDIKTSISNSHQYCEGVDYLLVNGELVIKEGKYTGKLPGEVIKLKE